MNYDPNQKLIKASRELIEALEACFLYDRELMLNQSTQDITNALLGDIGDDCGMCNLNNLSEKMQAFRSIMLSFDIDAKFFSLK
jgi:hypothetical protein